MDNSKENNNISIETLCNYAHNLLCKHKAEDIITINLKEKSDIADYMIICSGSSKRHITSLTDYLTEELKKYNPSILNIEGKDSGNWVLVDTGDIIIHLFRHEVRLFYGLERMWDYTV